MAKVKLPFEGGPAKNLPISEKELQQAVEAIYKPATGEYIPAHDSTMAEKLAVVLMAVGCAMFLLSQFGG